MTITNSAFRDHVLGKMSDLVRWSFKSSNFHAAFTVEMNMESRDCKIVMIVICARQSPGKLARFVIVNIYDGSNAFALRMSLFNFALEAAAGQIANGFRAVFDNRGPR